MQHTSKVQIRSGWSPQNHQNVKNERGK